jgi:hypothetical protein
MGTGGFFFPGNELLEREVDHLSPSNSEVKNEGSCTFIHPFACMPYPDICLFNNTGNIITMKLTK